MADDLQVGVVNYGGGNIQSVRNALNLLGAPFREVSAPADLSDLAALIFPGQGAFGDCMRQLEERQLVEALQDWVRADRPFFGICIGYQVLFESSEENPGVGGLAVFPGAVRRFSPEPEIKIPHMGWNTAEITASADDLWQDMGESPYFYFVHSYFPAPEHDSLVSTWTTYGRTRFASSIQHGNVIATQFHPEKSQANGLRLIGSFLRRHLQGA
jgi:imidazole glycerol phosphate synthase glutamine amidotransferase subunit